MLLGFETNGSTLTVTEEAFKWLPAGYRFGIQACRLRVLQYHSDINVSKLECDILNDQPFPFAKFSELGLTGQWDQVHGTGYAILLTALGDVTGSNFRDARFVAFYNISTRRHLEVPDPVNNLRNRQTNMLIGQQGLFRSKQIPFVHNNDSLCKLVRDIIRLCEEKYFGEFAETWRIYRDMDSGNNPSGRL